ncbi:hypothetical protein B7437_00935 [Staphylococcus aureus]|nr:hypothetical protein B7437_00935 [Staphylococcus aureus]
MVCRNWCSNFSMLGPPHQLLLYSHKLNKY